MWLVRFVCSLNSNDFTTHFLFVFSQNALNFQLSLWVAISKSHTRGNRQLIHTESKCYDFISAVKRLLSISWMRTKVKNHTQTAISFRRFEFYWIQNFHCNRECFTQTYTDEMCFMISSKIAPRLNNEHLLTNDENCCLFRIFIRFYLKKIKAYNPIPIFF